MGLNTSTISLCLIVKDEEKNLDRCLKSTHGYVDEIIVVDTGSQDATPDIAKSYGALVVYFPWQNDFSQARNKSLKHATKDWVLILDADEELPVETARNLRKLAGTPCVEAWTFTIVSPASFLENSQRTRNLNLRMFRNKNNYYFEGKIHEQVKPSILKTNAGAVIKYSNMTIMHYGYINGLKERRKKTLRNIAILQEALKDNPQDPFHNYNLGVSYFMLGDLKKSRKYYEVALQHLDLRSGFAAALYRNYCLCLGEIGDYSKALELADEGLAYFSDYPDLYFLKGQIFWDLGMLPQARASFLKCASFRRTLPEYTTTEGVTSYMAFENLARVFTLEGNFSEAVKYITLAITGQPSYRLLSSLCFLLQKQNYKGSEIATYLENNFGLDFRSIAQLLFDIQEFKACFTYIGRQSFFSPDMLILKAKCLMRLGRYAEAIETLQAVPPGSPQAEEKLKQQCIGMWLQNPRQDATALISSFGVPDSPTVISCRIINSLIVGGKIKANGNRQGEALNQALEIAFEVLSLGDEDLALATGLAVSGSNRIEEAYFILGKYALSKGYNQEAKKLLEQALNSSKVATEAHYLLGVVSGNLNLHNRAFQHFLKAIQQSPENELYTACALEQLVSQCLVFVLNGLNLEHGNAGLCKELFKLTSLKRKLHLLRSCVLSTTNEN